MKGEWENGRMGEWENGRMGEWENRRKKTQGRKDVGTKEQYTKIRQYIWQTRENTNFKIYRYG
jgi:hypothetical protein